MHYGLQPTAGGLGFRLVPVTFTHVGSAIAMMKKNSTMATFNMAVIMQVLKLQRYFSYKSSASEKHLTMRIAHVLPHADATIKSFLPVVACMNSRPSPFEAGHYALSAEKEHAATPAATQPVPEPAMWVPRASHTPPGLNKAQDIGQQSDPEGSTTSSSAVSSQCKPSQCFSGIPHTTALQA